MSTLVGVLAVVGGVTALWAVYSVFDFVALHSMTTSRPLQAYRRPGPEPSFALITGAGAGIGLGLANELVKHGFGVILLGHLEDELAEAKRGIEKATPGAVVHFTVMNARTATPREIMGLVASLGKLNVTILMNNVGGNPVAIPLMREMGTHSPADVDAVIDMNARFMARLTALMLPILSRKPKCPGERSLVLNISSAGLVGLPWLTMYGATKAFNLSFSRGLARELEQSSSTSHVDSLAVIPGDVLSQGNSKGVASDAPTADVYGKWIVWKVDVAIRRKMRELVPYWKHDLEGKILPWIDERTRTSAITNAVAAKKMAWDAHFAKAQ